MTLLPDGPHVFIGGHWRPAAAGGRLVLHNPSTGAPLAEIARGLPVDIDAAVAAARAALEGPWGRLSGVERGRILMRLSALVAEAADALALIEADDVGKPVAQGRADALALARYLEFYGGAADKIHGDTIPYQAGYTVLTLREPHGVTAHIVPWNYPMQIIGRSVGAALAAGNAVVVKPAEEACLSVLAFARLAGQAGLPDGALNVVPGLGGEAGAALAAHPGIDHVSFTGSPATGALVQAAAAAKPVPVTLELGGKSPQIVFADADLDRAMPLLVTAAVQNAGQTCSAGSRILIAAQVFPEVAQRLAQAFRGLVAGPARSGAALGPVISPAHRDRILGAVARARADGVKVLAEGRIADDAPAGGAYVQPLLFGPVPPDHPLAQEEIFGPVLALLPFDDEREAIALANGTPYGLVAGVWTADGGRGLRIARALHCGQVFINNYGAGGGVELPFGGVGRSGHGREKGLAALDGFSRLKTVAIHHG